MAAISVTAASVGLGPSEETPDIEPVVLAATFTQGQPYYLDSSGQAALAGAGTEAKANVRGYILTPGDAGDWAVGVRGNARIKFGDTLTQGAQYVVGGTDGVTEEQSDLSTDEFISSTGRAVDTEFLDIACDPTGIQVPA